MCRKKFIPLVWLLCLTWSLFAMGCIEDYFLYFPSKYPQGFENVDQEAFPLEDCYFTSGDGVKLHAWFVPRQGAQASILWFHGNGGNIAGRLEHLAMMRRLGVHIFMLDYRGYGRSEGKPSEKGLYQDAEAAYHYLASRPGVSKDKIYLYGQSLGAAVAVYLAHKNPGAGVILEAGFSSLLDVAKDIYPWMPARLLTPERYDSLKRISQLKMPLLIIHGMQDDIIALEHSRRLYQKAPQPKELLLLPDAGHNDLYLAGGEKYWRKLQEFVGQ